MVVVLGASVVDDGDKSFSCGRYWSRVCRDVECGLFFLPFFEYTISMIVPR